MTFRARCKRHISFFIYPEFADTFPTLPVVSTLVRRGYRVSYVTTDRFAARVTELGAEFIRCPPHTVTGDDPLRSHTERTLVDVTRYYERETPDLVVHDTVSIVGRILANRWEIPSVQVSPDFRLDKRYPSRQAPKFFKAALDASPSFVTLLARHGIEGDGFCFARSGLNIYFYPRIFQIDGCGLDEDCYYAGRCAPERPHFEKWRPAATRDRPVVLVSTSTAFLQGLEYFNMCIDALAGLEWHVVLQISENIDRTSLGTLPPQFEVIQSKPQIGILPYVNLLICAAGMMTTMEAMYCGVPMLMITHGNLEPETYAENNVRLGIGRHLMKAETTVESIRRSMLEMSEDNELLARVERMQRVVRGDPGAEEVANRILQYVD